MSYESPAAHPTITEEERKYIEESIGETAQHSVTVSAILTLYHIKLAEVKITSRQTVKNFNKQVRIRRK